MSNDVQNKIEWISNNVSEAALYEQLAEECTELAQASLKKARKIRGENFTPKSATEINDNIVEELTDVWVCLRVLNLDHIDVSSFCAKIDRWVKRTEEASDDI